MGEEPLKVSTNQLFQDPGPEEERHQEQEKMGEGMSREQQGKRGKGERKGARHNHVICGSVGGIWQWPWANAVNQSA